MVTSLQVGFLVPVNEQNLEEEEEETYSIPKIPLYEGPNIIGRNNVPVTDKRLSRKHLTIIASPLAPADVIVEGMNPVVIRSQDQRKKLVSREKLTVKNGDVIELIPGHYLMKCVIFNGEKSESSQNMLKRTSNESSRLSEGEGVNQKRIRPESEHKASTENLKAELGGAGLGQESPSASIRQFIIPNGKLASAFRLLRVQGLPAWANTNAISIGDVVQGNVRIAILSNYMVDLDWLLSACPTLKKVPHVLVLHGEGDGTLDYMKRNKPANWILHKPPLPISYGTHHTKAMFLVYPEGVRIIVHTANLIYVDWNNKSQGLWMQDFPWKDHNTSSSACGFEKDLVDYLSALKWPEFNANLPLGSFNINSSFFKKFDYSSATVRLIASVPGYHSGPNLKKWGHMKMHAVLQECVFDKDFHKSPLVYQFSSLGSLDEKWMAELALSMSSGVSQDKTPLGVGEPLIVWPTVEDVRCSLEGYASGNAIPSPQKNVEKEFLKKYWAKWKARHTGRGRAMPHIKTFARYNGQDLAWLLLTSANLSKAAWGALQKNNSQLMIRSYELGVLFLPASIKQQRCGFSCTDNGNPSKTNSDSSEIQNEHGSVKISEAKRTKLVTLAWAGNKNTDPTEVIPLPLPYELPPQRYSSGDVPWSWDRRYHKKDVYGQVWPRQVQLYTSHDS